MAVLVPRCVNRRGVRTSISASLYLLVWFSFDAYAILFEWALIAASGGFASIIGAISISVWRARAGDLIHFAPRPA